MTDIKTADRKKPNKTRKLRNQLIDPSLQVKFALYSLLLSLSLVGVLIVVGYLRMREFTSILVELTGAEEEIRELLKTYYFDLAIWVSAVFLTFLAVTVTTYIKISHRLLGPSIAFHHHITALIAGNYEHRTFLRPKDAFKQIADDLNRLSANLEEDGPEKPSKPE